MVANYSYRNISDFEYLLQFIDPPTENLRPNFDDARMECTNQGADLASIESAEENQFIYEKIKYVMAVFFNAML